MKRFLGGFCEKEKGSKVDRGPQKTIFPATKLPSKKHEKKPGKFVAFFQYFALVYIHISIEIERGNFWQFSFYI